MLLPFSLTEISNVLFSLRSKAPSASGVLSPYSLKLLQLDISPLLLRVFNSALLTGVFPEPMTFKKNFLLCDSQGGRISPERLDPSGSTSIQTLRGANLASIKPQSNLSVYNNVENIVIFLGGNSARSIHHFKKFASSYIKDLEKLMARLQPHFPKAKFVLTSLFYRKDFPQALFKTINDDLVQFSFNKGFDIINLSDAASSSYLVSDGVHLNMKGIGFVMRRMKVLLQFPAEKKLLRSAGRENVPSRPPGRDIVPPRPSRKEQVPPWSRNSGSGNSRPHGQGTQQGRRPHQQQQQVWRSFANTARSGNSKGQQHPNLHLSLRKQPTENEKIQRQVQSLEDKLAHILQELRQNKR